MRVDVLEELPEDHGQARSALAESWNRIAMRMERPEVFFTYEWAAAVSRAFTDTLRPLILLVYESDQLQGVAALATNCKPDSTVSFLTASTADYCDFLSVPEQRGAVLAAVFDELCRMKIAHLVLANVPAESTTLRELPQIAYTFRFHLACRPAYECPVILLEQEDDRQAISHLVKRKKNPELKKMAKLGSVKVTHVSSEPPASELRNIVSAHISRFIATHRLSPLLRPDRRLFLDHLTRLLGRAHWLKISRLEIDDQPIAWNYGFRFLDCWFWYLPTFQIQFERYSPGSCLLQLLIQQACSDFSVKRLDFGLGGEAYKRCFANSFSETCNLELSRSSARHLAAAGSHWLVASAKRSPALEKRLRESRDRIRALRQRTNDSGFVTTAGYVLRRAADRIKQKDEILLFEAPSIDRPSLDTRSDPSTRLVGLDWDRLAQAAMLYESDPQTLECVMRYGERLRRGGAAGYVLQTSDGLSAQFLSIADFSDLSLSGIARRLESCDGSERDEPGRFAAAMIFDCWTPLRLRGCGFYEIAICQAAALLETQQKRAWIFTAPADESSARGILRAGFVYRFSLTQKRHWKAFRRPSS